MYKNAKTHKGCNALRDQKIKPQIIVRWTPYGQQFLNEQTRQWEDLPRIRKVKSKVRAPFLIKKKI